MYSISAGLFHKNKYSWILLSFFAQNALAPTLCMGMYTRV
ncbi:hypothetical protein [uncultured Gammaproteobacteria bacterium]|nr:hypothetical protein [uncultured Gammaproteobacteria bacterium]